MATNLTPHFTLEEFTASQTASRMGIPNQPQGTELDGVKHTAQVMEKVRTLLGSKPILISSGYRSPEVNRAVGGASNSAHMSGLAADFTCPGFGDPLAICKALEPHLGELGVDQLIHEYGDWVHLGAAAPGQTGRQQCLTIDNSGTRNGFA